jgi:hypothetical protein
LHDFVLTVTCHNANTVTEIELLVRAAQATVCQ